MISLFGHAKAYGSKRMRFLVYREKKGSFAMCMISQPGLNSQATKPLERQKQGQCEGVCVFWTSFKGVRQVRLSAILCATTTRRTSRILSNC